MQFPVDLELCYFLDNNHVGKSKENLETILSGHHCKNTSGGDPPPQIILGFNNCDRKHGYYEIQLGHGLLLHLGGNG